MRRIIPLATVLALIGCGSGGGGDGDSSGDYEDNRVCIINDSFNNQPEATLTVTTEADQAALDTIETQSDNAPFLKVPAICGDPAAIDAVIQTDELPTLSDFLATGRKVPIKDADESYSG